MSEPTTDGKRGYSWPAVEPGQDGAAHIATTHGAWSPALREPVAAAIYDEVIAGAPDRLRDDPLFDAEVREYAQVAAVAQMIYSHMVGQGLSAALDDVTEAEETTTEVHKDGRMARKARSRARRTVALAEQYRRYAAQASRMREGLRKAVLEHGAEAPQKDVMTLMAERIQEIDREAGK